MSALSWYVASLLFLCVWFVALFSAKDLFRAWHVFSRLGPWFLVAVIATLIMGLHCGG